MGNTIFSPQYLSECCMMLINPTNSTVVDITSANPSISEHLRRAGLTLKESVERAKMPTDNGNDSDATSAISQLSSTPRPDPEGDQDPVEILERDTERLLAMEVAKTLRQLHRKHTAGTSDYQFTFEQRMGLKPQSASRATEHEGVSHHSIYNIILHVGQQELTIGVSSKQRSPPPANFISQQNKPNEFIQQSPKIASKTAINPSAKFTTQHAAFRIWC